MTPATGPVAFVDDDDDLRAANAESLELAGFAPLPFASAAEALAVLTADFPGVVVSDIRMPRMDGLEFFHRLRALDPDLPMLLITGHGDIAMAVEAMRDGVYDFIAKPFPAERLISAVTRAMDRRRLVLDNRRLRAALATSRDEPDDLLIGATPAIDRLRRTVRHVADADVDVLVEGETGSGKEVVATALHRWSGRRARAFVAVNCGALPETVIESELFGHEAGAFTGAQKKRIGRIEHSDGGTLFLDELESMPAALQVRLLRVLETRTVSPLGTNQIRPVDLRVVAATKTDLGDPAARGDFREDLFYRLNVVTIRIPPLRERREDVPLLFAHFLGRAARRFRREPPELTEDARRFLARHDWPGNVRELVHFAERYALGLAPEILEGDGEVGAVGAPDGEADAGLPLPRRMELHEARLIRDALSAHAGDVRATVEALGLPRKTFYDKLARHGIEPGSYRPGR